MSQSEVNYAVTPTKTPSGCGDGVRPHLCCKEKPLQVKPRRPVPSCRRFATRPPPRSASDTEEVKVRLQKAIEALASNPKVTRRRSLTMAEITPSKSRMKTVPPLSELKRRHPPVKASPSTEVAGQRIYQLLVLNAWRRQKARVATLTDSLAALQTQNDNLIIQVDALHRLRQAESEKRTEAISKSQSFQHLLEQKTRSCHLLTEEKAALEAIIKDLREKERADQLTVENAKNDCDTARTEIQNLGNQLDSERSKIKTMREEKANFLETLSQKEREIFNLTVEIEELQEKLLDAQINLQDSIVRNNNFEDNLQSLTTKIESETQENAQLQQKLQELTARKRLLEDGLLDFKKTMLVKEETIKNLKDENSTLKMHLEEAAEDLKRERDRPWWKNAGELASASLHALQNAAYIMLPAIPNVSVEGITKTTSTSDITAN